MPLQSIFITTPLTFLCLEIQHFATSLVKDGQNRLWHISLSATILISPNVTNLNRQKSFNLTWWHLVTCHDFSHDVIKSIYREDLGFKIEKLASFLMVWNTIEIFLWKWERWVSFIIFTSFYETFFDGAVNQQMFAAIKWSENPYLPFSQNPFSMVFHTIKKWESGHFLDFKSWILEAS